MQAKFSIICRKEKMQIKVYMTNNKNSLMCWRSAISYLKVTSQIVSRAWVTNHSAETRGKIIYCRHRKNIQRNGNRLHRLEE